MNDIEAPLRWDHMRADNLQAWADLNNLIARFDHTEEFFEAADLAEDLESPRFTASRDSWCVWAGETMVAIGTVIAPEGLSNLGFARAYLFGGVHPGHRRRGIGQQLIEAQQRRGAALAAQRHPGKPGVWYVDGGIPGASARPMLEGRGFEVVRYFAHMARPATAGLLNHTPSLPDGIRLITPTVQMYPALRLVHNTAFTDHWGSGAMTEQAWQEERKSRTARSQFSTIAVDESGVALSYVWAAQWVKRELYIDLVGTAPGARGQGLAAACLSRTVNLALKSGDYDKVDLGVDSQSPTGATRLYEQLGFAVDRTFALYGRSIPSDTPSQP